MFCSAPYVFQSKIMVKPCKPSGILSFQPCGNIARVHLKSRTRRAFLLKKVRADIPFQANAPVREQKRKNRLSFLRRAAPLFFFGVIFSPIEVEKIKNRAILFVLVKCCEGLTAIKYILKMPVFHRIWEFATTRTADERASDHRGQTRVD